MCNIVYAILGRSARISGSHPSHLPAIAHQAALSGFDWVYYADQDYCRVSVIPDSKLCNIFACIYAHGSAKNPSHSYISHPKKLGVI